MGPLRYVVRQIRADWPVILSLGLVIALGAAAAAAVPRWTSATIASAGRDTIEEGDADLVYRQRMQATLTPGIMDQTAQQVITDEPALASVYPSMRWTVSTDEGTVDDSRTHFLSVRMPDRFHEAVRITEGALPSADVHQIDVDQPERDGLRPARQVASLPLIEVIVSADVAAEFRLDVGGQYRIQPPNPVLPGDRWYPILIRIAGIFEPVEPDWAGWIENADALAPRVEVSPFGDQILYGAVLADPAVMTNLAPQLPGGGPADSRILMGEIILPAAPTGNVSADLAEVSEALRRVESNLPGWLTQLDDEIATFEAQYVASKRVTALGVLSAAALWAIVLALVVRLAIDRRIRALTLSRTRGAGTQMTVRHLILEGAIVAIPAAAVGALAGVIAMPEPDLTVSYLLPPGIAVLILIALPAYGIGMIRHDSPTGRPRSRFRTWQRRVAEAGLIIAGAAALWVASARTAAGTSVDPVISLTPVIVAVGVGLGLLRVFPILMGSLHRVARLRAGSGLYLSTRWAVHNRTAAVLPTVAMLVAVGLAALSSSIDASADRTRDTATWSDTPGDIVVTSSGEPLRPDVAGQLGADVIAAAYPVNSEVTRSDSTYQAPTVLAVDVEAWQEVTGRAPVAPAPVAALSAETSPPPAIVTGSFGSHEPLTAGDEVQIGDVPVQISDVVPVFHGIIDTPTIVVPADAVPGQFDRSAPSALFIAGDLGLDAVDELEAAFPDAVVYSRMQALAEIDADPLLSATLEIYRIVLVAAVALAATAAAVSLLVAANARVYGLSVLHTLGYSRRQAIGLVAAEVLPSAVVAAAVGIALGSAVTALIADALNLTALTTTLGFTSQTVIDVPTTVTVASGIVVAVAVAIVLAIAIDRPARLGSALRIGE